MANKFFIRKNTFEDGKVSYSVVISNKDTDGTKVATAYMPANFKKDNMPDAKYERFLIESDKFFLSAYPIETADGKKTGKPKIIFCEYSVVSDYTNQSASNSTPTLEPIDEDSLPF